jgi:hypothetical protein
MCRESHWASIHICACSYGEFAILIPCPFIRYQTLLSLPNWMNSQYTNPNCLGFDLLLLVFILYEWKKFKLSDWFRPLSVLFSLQRMRPFTFLNYVRTGFQKKNGTSKLMQFGNRLRWSTKILVPLVTFNGVVHFAWGDTSLLTPKRHINV